MKISILFLLMLFITTTGCLKQPENKENYQFNGKISEEVLRNYLSRALTMAEVCTAPQFRIDGEDNCRDDDIRLIKNLRAKFIGRAIFRWGIEQDIVNDKFFEYGEKFMKKVHESDPNIIFQACIFEAVTPDVAKIEIPKHVFKAFGLPVQTRTFDYKAMLFKDGLFVNHFDSASVPDITRIETEMWFYFLATKYIDAGYEAIHWGQIALIGYNDKNLTHWFEMLKKVREYAKNHSRRHYILQDGHSPDGGFLKDGTHLLDFNSFPLRLLEKEDEPMAIELPDEVHLNSIYNRSKGGMTASGWSCESLPYLVEFDNCEVSDHPGEPNRKDHHVWGYDEISWFSIQSPEDQKKYLEYIYHAIKDKDPNGYLQMPICRVVMDGKNPRHKFKGNLQSDACPNGTGLEEKVKELWK